VRHLLAVLVGIPLAWHLAAVAGTVYDAGRVGMRPLKWGGVVLFVPLFGFFAYLLERSERTADETDLSDDGTYNVHDAAGEDRHPRSRGRGPD
jgi:hypothetical protein